MSQKTKWQFDIGQWSVSQLSEWLNPKEFQWPPSCHIVSDPYNTCQIPILTLFSCIYAWIDLWVSVIMLSGPFWVIELVVQFPMKLVIFPLWRSCKCAINFSFSNLFCKFSTSNIFYSWWFHITDYHKRPHYDWRNTIIVLIFHRLFIMIDLIQCSRVLA